MLNKSLNKEIKIMIDDCYVSDNKMNTNNIFIKQSMQENIQINSKDASGYEKIMNWQFHWSGISKINQLKKPNQQ